VTTAQTSHAYPQYRRPLQRRSEEEEDQKIRRSEEEEEEEEEEVEVSPSSDDIVAGVIFAFLKEMRKRRGVR
jgi:hypothetical protein